jgi:hypothetical protein
VLRIIKQEEDSGCFVDYITLSSSLLFSLNYTLNYGKLSSETLYNKVRKSDCNTEGYLDHLEIVRKDYRELFAQYRGKENVLFVVDPPYLSTDISSYSSGACWELKDCLNVLNVLSADNYVYFTSDKSSIIELFEWLGANYMLRNPFSKAKTNTVCQYMGRSGRYTDLMYYKNYKR